MTREDFSTLFAGAVQLALQKHAHIARTRGRLGAIVRAAKRRTIPDPELTRLELELRRALAHDGDLFTAALEDVGAVLYQLSSPPTPPGAP